MKFALSRRLGLALLGVSLLAVFAFVAARSGPLAPTRVTVVKVGEGAVAPALFGIGTVEARRSYLVGPTVAGRVLRVLVDVGDAVKAGQLLAEMEPVDLDERLRALEASGARAASAVDAALAQLQDARARRELAAINARRYVELGEKKFVSAGAVEARLQEEISAQAGANAAEANLAGARQELLRLDAERAGLRQQRRNIRLLAPSDGLVTARDAEAGSTAVAGQAVLKLVDPASLWVKLRLDQGRSAGLQPGLPAEIALRSDPSRPLPGRVVRVEPLSDSVTEERIALVAFAALPAGLAVGELAEVTLKLPAAGDALLLPNAAVKQRGDAVGVWLARGGEPRFVPVRLGQSDLDGRVQVLHGLRAGDEVVVHSERELAAGRRIEVVASLAGRGA